MPAMNRDALAPLVASRWSPPADRARAGVTARRPARAHRMGATMARNANRRHGGTGSAPFGASSPATSRCLCRGLGPTPAFAAGVGPSPRHDRNHGASIRRFYGCMRTPHDEFFRAAFGDPDRASHLARVALPGRIRRSLNLDAVEIERDTYVDSGLRPYHSDLLLRTTTRGRNPLLVYILFEHKASPDPRTLYQLLRYMVRIWQRWCSRKENRAWRHLPPILPVILSQAPRRWNYSLQFATLVRAQPGMDLGPHTPTFSAILLDLASIQESELGEDKLVHAILAMLKHVRADSPDESAAAFGAIWRSRRRDRDRELFEAAVTYFLRARQADSPDSILKVLPSDESRRVAMTIADRLKKEGRQEGRLEDKREVLQRQLDRRFGLSEGERKLIGSQTNPKKLDNAIDTFVFAKSKDDVLEQLR